MAIEAPTGVIQEIKAVEPEVRPSGASKKPEYAAKGVMPPLAASPLQKTESLNNTDSPQRVKFNLRLGEQKLVSDKDPQGETGETLAFGFDGNKVVVRDNIDKAESDDWVLMQGKAEDGSPRVYVGKREEGDNFTFSNAYTEDDLNRGNAFLDFGGNKGVYLSGFNAENREIEVYRGERKAVEFPVGPELRIPEPAVPETTVKEPLDPNRWIQHIPGPVSPDTSRPPATDISGITPVFYRLRPVGGPASAVSRGGEEIPLEKSPEITAKASESSLWERTKKRAREIAIILGRLGPALTTVLGPGAPAGADIARDVIDALNKPNPGIVRIEDIPTMGPLAGTAPLENPIITHHNTDRDEGTGMPEVINGVPFIHPKTEGLSKKGLEEHWLALCWDELHPEEREAGIKSMYEEEMAYREGRSDGLRRNNDDERLVSTLAKIPKEVYDEFLKEFDMSIDAESSNQGKVTAADDPDNDRIARESVFSQNPLTLLRKVMERMKGIQRGANPL